MNYKYLFGPVPSRRLGMSLGVDMVPYKVCNLDCIYCESGLTTVHTIARTEYIIYDDLIKELKDCLSDHPKLDYITFSGAGEPTLNINLSNVIDFLKSHYPQYKLALITNSLLLTDADVRNDIMKADVVLPSLDAVSEEIFHIVNRPKQGTNSADIINGLLEFKKQYKGDIWMEVFLIPGINDDDQELKLLKEVLIQINPQKVHLNTLDRPGPEKWVFPVSTERLEYIADFFKPLNVEIIARKSTFKAQEGLKGDPKEIILTTLSRRPMTSADLQSALKLDSKQLKVYLDILVSKKLITIEKNQYLDFYKAV